MRYKYKIWIGLHLSWIWRIFGYCGHIDTCNQLKLKDFRDACCRYEVPHIEDDWSRVYSFYNPKD